MNTHRVRLAPLLFAIFASLGASACIVDVFVDDDDDNNINNTSFEASRSFSETIPMNNRTRVRVVAVNGWIEVRGDPNIDVIEVSGDRIVGSSSTADAESHLDDLRVDITASATEVLVETRHPFTTGGRRYEVHYTIRVPDELEVTVGQVNGAIDVWGPLEDLDIDNTNGAVRALDLIDSADIDVANGTIDVDMLELNGDLDVTSANGTLDVTIPADASAELSAAVVNGSVQVVGLTLTDEVVTARSHSGTLGTGLHAVQVNTVNGDIVIRGS